LGFALGVYLLVAAWLRRRQEGSRRAPHRWHGRLGTALGGASLLAYVGLFLFIRPSTAELVSLTSAGHLDSAELHAEALQAQGETGPDFVVARTAFVLARVDQLDNRAAIAFIGRFLDSRAGTEPLEAERRRLRQQWAAVALDRGQEATVEEELDTLELEGAPQPLVDDLRGQLENRRITVAKELLAKGEVTKAISILTRIKAPHLASERPEPILMHAYLEQARGCPERGLQCRATALERAVTVSPGDEARTALAAFRAAELSRLQAATRATGDVGRRLRILEAAEADANMLLSSLDGDEDLKTGREAVVARREQLVKGRLPFNEPIEVAEYLLGPSSLQEQKPGILKLTKVPPGLVAFFFVANGISRGLYVTSAKHGQESLSTTTLQHLVKVLTGHEFATKDLKRTKPGVAHVRVRLGKHPALLGWHDGQLVEASIGKVEP